MTVALFLLKAIRPEVTIGAFLPLTCIICDMTIAYWVLN
jgi:hypothetical protein